MKRTLLTLGDATIFALAVLIPAQAASDDPIIRGIGRGETKSFTVYLEGGITYAIAAIAGDEAMDLDLELYDDNGRFCVEDTASDASAVVTWTPCWSGTFTFEVKNCGAGGLMGIAVAP
jgi:hypothetical protein